MVKAEIAPFMMRKLLLPWIFFLSCHSDTVRQIQQSDIIAIAPLNHPKTASVSELKDNIEKFYGCKVILLPNQSIPSSAFYKKRARYRADSMLIFLETVKPDSVDFILGLTDSDISATVSNYKDWGVFGYGQCPGVSNVISTFRLKKNADQAKISTRLKNVAIHEIGHNYGLPHCGDTTCIMKDAHGKLSSIEGKSRYLCGKCQKRIQYQAPR